MPIPYSARRLPDDEHVDILHSQLAHSSNIILRLAVMDLRRSSPTKSAKSEEAASGGGCPLCHRDIPPSSKAPPDDPNNADDTSEAEIVWIGCTKCATWSHTVCILRGEEGQKTIPQEILDSVEEEGIWWDWTVRVNKWYCSSCTAASEADSSRPTLQTSLKKRPQQRLSASGRPKRKAAEMQVDYHALHHHISSPTAKWLALIRDPKAHGRVIKETPYRRLPGNVLSKEWVEGRTEDAKKYPPEIFHGPDREPFVVTPADGGFESMGGKLPPAKFTVADVARLVGPDVVVPVIDVATQNSEKWPLSRWSDYVTMAGSSDSNPDAPARPSIQKPDLKIPVGRVYNVISLEISGSELAKQVKPPRLVSEIDWVDNFWPANKRMTAAQPTDEAKPGDVTHANGGKTTPSWPKVQLYCLMGMKGAWTDWHIDFSASSVYYTIHTGSKTFFFIKPTEQNLAAYQRWSGDADAQQNTWLPDWCDEVRKVTLKQGDTMIIPAGYIHAVYTPMDSIVFGGNFIHSYNVETQLRLREIENQTKVPLTFRFPFHDRLCWYVAERYCQDLRARTAYRPSSSSKTDEDLHPRVLSGLAALSDFLVKQLRIMESSTSEDKIRKRIHDKIPGDKIKDPHALARELRWRVRRASGEDSEQEEQHLKTLRDHEAAPSKRRRLDRSVTFDLKEEPAKPGIEFAEPARTRHLEMEPWEVVEDEAQQDERQIKREDGRDALEKTATHSQRRRRTRHEDDMIVQEEQSVQVTTKVTSWKVRDSASQAGTPEISKETDSTVSDTAGPLTPDQPDTAMGVAKEKADV